MTTDEEYAARLRASVRIDELRTDMQPEQILHTSRRAQRRRTVRTSAVVLCGVLAVGPGASALVQDLRRAAEAAPAVQPQDLEVAVDTTDGTITLPWDRYFLTDHEQAEVNRASGLAVRACAAERGYDLPAVGDTGSFPSDRRYGIWWMPEVEVYGYDVPTTPGQAGDTPPPPTDEQTAILEECHQTPTVQQLGSGTRLSEVTPDFAAQAFESDAGRRVFRDWEACLEVHGLRRDEAISPWAVSDGTGERPPGVATAVIDAQCKEDVDLVARLAQLEANLQAPYIAEHRAELIAMRAALDQTVQNARAYVAEHG